MEGLSTIEAELLLDVTNSRAFRDVEQLVASGEITTEQAQAAKQHYASIHKHFVVAMSNEKMLLEEAKGLKRQLEESQSQAELAASASASQHNPEAERLLREDVEAAHQEVVVAQEREQMCGLEVGELQRQRNELRERVQEIEDAHRATLQPQLDALHDDLTQLSADVRGEADKRAVAEQELGALRAALEKMDQERQVLGGQVSAEKIELDMESVGPAKTRRAVDLLVNALKGVHAQEDQLQARLTQQDGQLAGFHDKVRGLQARLNSMQGAIDRANVAIEAKQRAEDDIRKDLEIARLEAENAQAERVGHDMELDARVAATKRERDMLIRRMLDREKAFRHLRVAEAALEAAQDQLPPLMASKEAGSKHLAQIQHQQSGAQQTVADLKRDTDILINAFLKEEKRGDAKNALFKASWEEVQALEDEIGLMKQEEAERLQAIRALTSQRTRIASLAAENARQAREAGEEVSLKQLVVEDLKRVRKQVQMRVRDFQQLYELVKNQRNKFVSLVAVAGQGIAELKEKLKMLGNEFEILRGEEINKQKLLERAQSEHGQSVSSRDQQRSELNKCSVHFRKRQTMVDEQIAEIDKLNAVINAAERDMLKLRKEYEGAIEARNYTGVCMIDRNDELCILYEKANIQEEVMKKGQMALQRREDEIRMLRLEVAEMVRAVDVPKRLLPIIPGVDLDITCIKTQLLETRRQAEELALQLESPANKERWRRLEGKIPDREELCAKISQLEERLHGRREALLEKDLILEELGGLSDRLRSLAAEGREDTLCLAQKVNDFQVRLRSVTRRMMATVSELSMWQATGIKLEAQQQELEVLLAEAMQRLEAEEPPTEDAEREWQRILRERQQLADMREQAQLLRQAQEEQDTAAPSMAEGRPNAYIPEDLGIPKPYGGFAPFKPSEAGSTMRHIQPPRPREIVI